MQNLQVPRCIKWEYTPEKKKKEGEEEERKGDGLGAGQNWEESRWLEAERREKKK